MSYQQAFAVGWSIFWRQMLWMILPGIALFAVSFAAPHSLPRPLILAAILLTFEFLITAGVILSVLDISYTEFRLEPRRAGQATTVHFWEALAFAVILDIVPNAAAPLFQLALGRIPVIRSLVLVLYPILVGAPLMGLLLTSIPLFKLRICFVDPLMPAADPPDRNL